MTHIGQFLSVAAWWLLIWSGALLLLLCGGMFFVWVHMKLTDRDRHRRIARLRARYEPEQPVSLQAFAHQYRAERQIADLEALLALPAVEAKKWLA